MTPSLTFLIVLKQPPAGVLYALQQGAGKNYLCIQPQLSDGSDLIFRVPVRIRDDAASTPDFAGPFVQGSPEARFIYIDIGTCAGQSDSIWSRRLKVPLKGITGKILKQALSDPGMVLETTVPGTGKDGGPSCATVKPFEGWRAKIE